MPAAPIRRPEVACRKKALRSLRGLPTYFVDFFPMATDPVPVLLPELGLGGVLDGALLAAHHLDVLTEVAATLRESGATRITRPSLRLGFDVETHGTSVSLACERAYSAQHR